MPDWFDEPGLPHRMKSGARRAVREILICIVIVTVGWAAAGAADQGGNPLVYAGAGLFLVSWWAGPLLWAVYRTIRFAIGR